MPENTSSSAARITELDRLLTQTLKEIMEQQVGQLPEEEMQLIVHIAKEMVTKDTENFPQGVNKSSLQFSDMRDRLGATLVAATSVALFITQHHDLHEECRDLFDEFKAASQNPKVTADQLKQIKEKFKNKLRELNKLEPNAKNRERNEKMIDDDDLMDKLVDMEKQIQGKVARKDKPKTGESKSEDDRLDRALQNLFGIDPHIPGKIVGPVQVVIGDMVGIPDAYPAFSNLEPIHVLSGDMTSTGDKHMEVPRHIANPEGANKLNEVSSKEATELFGEQAKELLNAPDLNNTLYNVARVLPHPEPPH